MAASDIVVVDYGVGNLLSVRRGFEHFGARVEVTADHSTILAAPRVVLPGVGAFAGGMKELRRHGLDEVVREVTVRGTPLLGICLGMQMLFDESEEYGRTSGLGLIPGRVIPVPAVASDGGTRKIPHIGWNGLVPPTNGAEWGDTLLAGVVPGDAVYFVHSFMASPADSADRLADCNYDGVAIPAVVRRGNVCGCQFHPEKSGAVGLSILGRFLSS